MDCISQGFSKAIEQTIPNIFSCLCLRDSSQMLNLNFIWFTLYSINIVSYRLIPSLGLPIESLHHNTKGEHQSKQGV